MWGFFGRRGGGNDEVKYEKRSWWTLEEGKHAKGGSAFDKQSAGVPSCHVRLLQREVIDRFDHFVSLSVLKLLSKDKFQQDDRLRVVWNITFRHLSNCLHIYRCINVCMHACVRAYAYLLGIESFGYNKDRITGWMFTLPKVFK